MCLGCQKNSNKKKNTNACPELYNELISLDSQVIDKYKETKEPNFLMINKQLRIWINNLKYQCPPESELDLIRQIIKENEHPID